MQVIQKGCDSPAGQQPAWAAEAGRHGGDKGREELPMKVSAIRAVQVRCCGHMLRRKLK